MASSRSSPLGETARGPAREWPPAPPGPAGGLGRGGARPAAAAPPPPPPRRSRGGLEHHLRPAIVARVEVLVGLRCLTERQPVRDDEGRLRAAIRDQVPQLPVIRL